jgi:hypothetical protein
MSGSLSGVGHGPTRRRRYDGRGQRTSRPVFLALALAWRSFVGLGIHDRGPNANQMPSNAKPMGDLWQGHGRGHRQASPFMDSLDMQRCEEIPHRELKGAIGMAGLVSEASHNGRYGRLPWDPQALQG